MPTLKPCDGRAAIVGVMLHVPEMAELMFRAGSGAAGFGRLHGEAAEHEALDQLGDGRRLRGADAGGIGDHGAQTALDNFPGGVIDGFHAERVGHDPIRAGGDFGQQIRVTPGVHFGGRGANDIRVRNDCGRARGKEKFAWNLQR